MADTTLNDRFFAYLPNQTLGRSDFQESAEDKLHRNANQLDALLCVLTSSTEMDDGFNACNDTIQRTVLELASRLATEINELQKEMMFARMSAREAAMGATT